jgi:hypothetical protein
MSSGLRMDHMPMNRRLGSCHRSSRKSDKPGARLPLLCVDASAIRYASGGGVE